MPFTPSTNPSRFSSYRGIPATWRRSAGASLLALALAACSASNNHTSGSGGSSSASTASGSGGATTSGTGGDAACQSDVQAAPGTVVTDRGAVKGAQSGTTWVYRGIPYAAPPVGALRFKPTVEHTCWQGTVDTTACGAECLQLDANQKPTGSEDCLTMNVWVPAAASPTTPLPVLFFIHGGGNTEGSPSEQLADGSYTYDGQALAESRGAVVVTFQYRLQAAGFLSLPQLDAESPQKSSGNYAMLDQVFALGWVQRNIHAFGGDPAHVLLFGQSAGALDVCAVLSSPLAKGLFSAALMESGGCTALTKTAAQAFGATVVAGAQCQSAPSVVACLRALTADALVTAVPTIVDIAGKQSGYQPNVDGWVLPQVPLDTITAGKHNHVPFVVGANKDETGKSVKMLDENAYEAAVAMLVGSQALAKQVLAEYPATAYGNSPTAAYIAFTSDLKFICTARKVARAAVAGQTELVERYFYTHVLDNGSATTKAFGAFHGSELLFVFDHLDSSGYQPSAGETALAAALGGYWERLAATGDTNGSGAVAWPAYDATTDSYLQLDDTIVAGAGVRTEQCDFLDGLGL
jgi:para-nitrobenzyl esterase